jgi:hypothetical protein
VASAAPFSLGDGMTTLHSAVTDPDIHEPKGASTALAGQVYVADGAGSGAWQAQAVLPTNTVVVAAASDFPDAVAGVRTLADDTIYEIIGDVSVGSDRFVFGNNTFLVGSARARRLNSITSTTTGSLFTGTGVNATLIGLTLVATTAAELITFDGTNTGVLSIENVQSLSHTGSVMTLTNIGGLLIYLGIFVGGTDGITFSGANNQGAFIQLSNFIGFSGTGIDLSTAVLQGMQILNSSIKGDAIGPDVGISGLTAGGNFGTGTTGYVQLVDFGATSTALGTITEDDDRWDFRDNRGTKNTSPEAMGYINGSATTTAIAASVTPVLVDTGAAFVSDIANRFTISNGGRLTYDGETTRDFHITYSVQFTGASGTNTFNFYVAKNGTVITSSKLGREVSSTGTAALSSFCIAELASTDYIEVWVENDGSTTDCDVIDLKIMVI